MLKLTCLVLLATMAISWSQVDARSQEPLKRGLPLSRGYLTKRAAPVARAYPYGLKRSLPIKRQASSDELGAQIDQLSEESQQTLAKELLAGLILLTVDSDNSSEIDQLTLAFKKAASKHYDNIDDYATELAKIYKEVTGRELDVDN